MGLIDRLVGPWLHWLYAGAALFLAAMLATQSYRVQHFKALLATEQRDRALESARQAREAAAAMAAYREEEQRRTAAHTEIAHATDGKLAVAQSDAASAATAHDRLQRRVAALVASRPAACNPSAAAAGPPAPDPGLVLTELFRRLDERAGLLAGLADERGIRGTACEAAYDALTR